MEAEVDVSTGLGLIRQIAIDYEKLCRMFFSPGFYHVNLHLSSIICLHGASFECLFREQIYKFENPIKCLKLSMDPPGIEAREACFCERIVFIKNGKDIDLLLEFSAVVAAISFSL